MKFDAENQHAEAFKCRGFDGYVSANGDDGIVTGGDTKTKLGGLVTKGTDFAKSDKGKAAIALIVSKLNVNTKYFVRSYAINEKGIAWH